MAFTRFQDIGTATSIRQIDDPAVGPMTQESRLSAVEIQELEDFLDNEQFIQQLNTGVEIDATLLTLLSEIVDKQKAGDKTVEELRETLDKLTEMKLPVTAEQMEQGLEEFQTEAIKAYQRIASTTISIIEGEMSALTTGVPGAFSFEGDTAKEMRTTEIQIFGGGSRQGLMDTNRFLEAYEQQIDDVLAALKFMVNEIDLTKQLLNKSKDQISEIVDLDSPFQITVEVGNLITATTEYLEILGETSFLENAIGYFTKAQSGLKGVIRKRPQSTAGKFTNMTDPESRAWGSNVIQGMATFAKFACRLSEAEGDLNKINQVDGAGVVRRGLGRAFNDIIVLDQKFYPMNNQIPIPPISVSPIVIKTYLEAYEERATELVTATDNQLNQINNKFDRKIANAQRNINQLSETLLMPKPAARSSIARTQINAIETPEAFFSRTTGIPLEEVPRNLERRRSRRIEEATAEEEKQARLLLEAEAAAQRASQSMGSNVMKVNPRKKRQRKK